MPTTTVAATLGASTTAVTGALTVSVLEPAFADIIAWFTPDRRATALLAVTIVAGFASAGMPDLAATSEMSTSEFDQMGEPET